jgi:hypothetical protein
MSIVAGGTVFVYRRTEGMQGRTVFVLINSRVSLKGKPYIV